MLDFDVESVIIRLDCQLLNYLRSGQPDNSNIMDRCVSSELISQCGTSSRRLWEEFRLSSLAATGVANICHMKMYHVTSSICKFDRTLRVISG